MPRSGWCEAERAEYGAGFLGAVLHGDGGAAAADATARQIVRGGQGRGGARRDGGGVDGAARPSIAFVVLLALILLALCCTRR